MAAGMMAATKKVFNFASRRLNPQKSCAEDITLDTGMMAPNWMPRTSPQRKTRGLIGKHKARIFLGSRPPSSSGLGHHPFKVKITGSNPVGGTIFHADSAPACSSEIPQ
jgi:hypothetical protein